MTIQDEMKSTLSVMLDDVVSTYNTAVDSRDSDDLEVLFVKIKNGEKASMCMLVRKEPKVGVFLLEARNYEDASNNKAPLKVVHRRASLDYFNEDRIKIIETLLEKEPPMLAKQEECQTRDLVDDFAFWLADAPIN